MDNSNSDNYLTNSVLLNDSDYESFDINIYLNESLDVNKNESLFERNDYFNCSDSMQSITNNIETNNEFNNHLNDYQMNSDFNNQNFNQSFGVYFNEYNGFDGNHVSNDQIVNNLMTINETDINSIESKEMVNPSEYLTLDWTEKVSQTLTKEYNSEKVMRNESQQNFQAIEVYGNHSLIGNEESHWLVGNYGENETIVTLMKENIAVQEIENPRKRHKTDNKGKSFEQKREERRKSTRIAVKKCKQKKLNQILELENKKKQLNDENLKLENEVIKMRKKVSHSKMALQWHKMSNGCRIKGPK